MISNFTILGERCSGTNYLELLMLENFNIDITWKYGWKHFFGFYDFKKNEEEDQTLFIGIVRHPVTWIDSFYKNQHHIPNQPKPLKNFLFKEFYSVDEKNKIMQNDLNYITKNKYKNIFEMRFYKNYYLLNIIQQNVKNYILINYENLRDNTEDVLSTIKSKFNLTQKFPFYKNIKNYKKTDKKYTKKEIELPINYKLIISKCVNLQQESRLGYNLGLTGN